MGMAVAATPAQLVPDCSTSGDDSDAPEEVTLQQSMESARHKRSEERDQRRLREVEAKEQRRRASGPKGAAPVDGGTASPHDGMQEAVGMPAKRLRPRRREQGSSGAPQDEQVTEYAALDHPSVTGSEMIPRQASASAGASKAEARGTAVAGVVAEEEVDRQRAAKKRRKVQQKLAHANIVVLRQEEEALLPVSAAAIDFRQNRLYGAHVPRSFTMLPKAPAQLGRHMRR
eukprot:SM000002S05717  [mRNA]  locus=s2:1843018:1844543:+ [translate_table: standard]